MRFLLRHVGRRFLSRLFLAALFLALLDTLGVAIIFPYLALLTADAPVDGAGYVAQAYRLAGASSRTQFVVLVSAGLAAFFVFKFLAGYALTRMRFRTNAHITTRLSDDLFTLLLRADYGSLANRSVSEMAGIVNAETIHATLCLDAWVTIATEVVFVALVLITIVSIDARLALLLLAALAAVTAILYFGVVKRSARLGATQSEIHLWQYRFLFGVVSALKDIKILGLEAGAEREHRRANARYAGAVASFNVNQSLPRTIIELLVMIALLAASVALVLGQADLKAAVPVIGFLAVAALRLVPSYGRTISAYGSYRYYQPSLEAMRRLFADLTAIQAVPRHAPAAFEHAIEIRGLRFSHGDQPVLNGITLTIRKGQSVGIVGLSGSGKTTFLDVLAGLRRPDGGEFFLDGSAVDPFGTDTLRRLLGYVPQNVTLIDDTIAFNIAFEVEPEAERLRRAARAARIEAFVGSLPQGYATVVGENGVRVSGGQKQRIGIARALYRDPQLLIFDEATSSLDNVTERELNVEIGSLAPAKTLVIVAHRLSTVAKCDVIYVFDDGRIAGSGTHASLLQTNPVYRTLYRTQEHAAGGAAAADAAADTP
jgi:ATP-binding cassette, subfamily B, bacterial PglK